MEEVHRFPGHQRKCKCLAIDGENIFAGFEDAVVKMFSLTEMMEKATFPVEAAVEVMKVVRPFMFLGLANGKVLQISLDPSMPGQNDLMGHKGSISMVALHGEDLVTASADGQVARWVYNQATRSYSTETAMVAAVGAAIYSGTVHSGLVFLGTVDGSILVHSADTLQQVQAVPKAHHKCVSSLLVHPEGLLSSCVDGIIKSWGPGPGGAVLDPRPKTVQNAGQTHPVYSLCPTRNAQGQCFVLVCYSRWDPLLLELPGIEKRLRIKDVYGPRAIGTAPDQGLLACGLDDGTIILWRWLEPGAVPVVQPMAPHMGFAGPGGYNGGVGY